MTILRIVRISALAFSVAMIGTVIAIYAMRSSEASRPVAQQSESVAIGGPFALVDQDGNNVTDRDFSDKASVIFFGYTSCPDACPTTLLDLSNWLRDLGPDARRLNVLFISIDPERDTPARIKEYLSSFDPRIHGLTGTPEQIAATAKAYRVSYERVELEGGDYTMDHTAAIYLMDRSGHFVAPLSLQTEDKVALERLHKLAAL
jgi:protein SCO1/2